MKMIQTLNVNESASMAANESFKNVNTTDASVDDFRGSLDAFMYIVVVLLFYVCSIVLLMVKFIKRENEEGQLRVYYDEFVKRDHFNSPQYQNWLLVKATLRPQLNKGNNKYEHRQQTLKLPTETAV